VLDLDGTLVDSVYQHVVAWQEALAEIGVSVPAWRVHRRVGMSGAAFVDDLTREAGVVVDDVVLRRLSSAHAAALGRQSAPVGVLPGAKLLLAELSRIGLPWAVTTNGTLRFACPALELLGVYDTPGRDPRGWTVSVVYLDRCDREQEVAGADDAADARWFPAGELPALAFDHALIIEDALRRS
jgi:8-oxo-dGTP pyrophosphatase MutT (NUDIX family)